MNVGVLGGGQLSLMLAEASHSLDIEIVFIDPAPDACANRRARQIVAEYDDSQALAELAQQADVITYEFENVPSEAVSLLSQKINVFPAVNALSIAQDRLLEKQRFVALGIPVPQFRPIDQLDELKHATSELGFPCVLKTRRFGYDGKGQAVINSAEDIENAWQSRF